MLTEHKQSGEPSKWSIQTYQSEAGDDPSKCYQTAAETTNMCWAMIESASLQQGMAHLQQCTSHKTDHMTLVRQHSPSV